MQLRLFLDRQASSTKYVHIASECNRLGNEGGAVVKATLEFSLPEERIDHLQAVHALEAWGLLHDLDAHLRNVVKHGEGGYKTVNDLAIFLRTEIGEVLQHIDT
jgi:hypothetical protein